MIGLWRQQIFALTISSFLFGSMFGNLPFFRTAEALQNLFNGGPAYGQTAGRDELMDYPRLYEQAVDAVVSIQAFRIDTRGEEIFMSEFSGFIISPDGTVLTSMSNLSSFFTFDGGLSSKIKLKAITRSSRTLTDLKIELISASSDIAVLKLAGNRTDYPFLTLDQDAFYDIGSPMMVIAYPREQGNEGGIGVGIVTELLPLEYSEQGLPYQLTRSSAQIPLLYCGAPILNSKGQVIGMAACSVERKYADHSGYFYSVRALTEALTILRTRDEKPAVGLGLRFLNVSDYAVRRKIYDLPRGIYIRYVLKDSAAYAGKLHEGDIITAVNDVPVTTLGQLRQLLNKAAPGDEWNVTVFRENLRRVETLTVYVEAYNDSIY